MEKGDSREGEGYWIRTPGEQNKRTHLPPTVIINIVLLDDLYELARTKRNFVFVLWEKVVASINVFYHGKYSVTRYVIGG
jgi:hypothetical protein